MANKNIVIMKRFLSFLVFAVLLGGYAMAYDFSAVCESGQTLYYNITSNVEPYTVEVVKNDEDHPSGDLIIPDLVGYNNIMYSVTNIENYAFEGCENLTSVVIGDSVTSIGSMAFFYCDAINSVTIGSSVTSIGEYAFSGCCGLFSVTLPNSVAEIGYGAFHRVRNIIYNGNATGSPWGALAVNGFVDGDLIYYDETRSILAGCSILANEVEIPSSVIEISSNAFSNCDLLTQITIPNTVSEIGVDAFAGCSGLTEPVYNDKIFAYFPCGYATEYAIPEGIQKIVGHSFVWCSQLTSISIPNSVTNIGSYAFSGCSNLTTISIPSSVTKIEDGVFQNCSNITSVILPNTITEIGENAFLHCSSLASIILPNSLTSIGSSAFEYCRSLTSITIPDSITEIKPNVFYGCRALSSVTFPDSITNIQISAFENCSSLTHLIVPNTVTEIGDNAFRSCSEITTITIGNSVEHIGSRAFGNCSSLTNLNFNATNCTMMGIPYLPSFLDCHNLSILRIGENVTNIPAYAFGGCTEINLIYSDAINPPILNQTAFEEDVLNADVYVPCGTEDDYTTSDVWSNFTNIQTSLYILNVLSSDLNMGEAFVVQLPDCENGEAIIEATANAGYQFVSWNDGNTDNPRTITVVADVTYIASFTSLTGIEESAVSEIALFPNPATDILNITSSETISEIEIVNVMGQVVKRIEVNSDNAVCDVEDLTSGVYMVRIRTLRQAQGAALRKFIKE